MNDTIQGLEQARAWIELNRERVMGEDVTNDRLAEWALECGSSRAAIWLVVEEVVCFGM